MRKCTVAFKETKCYKKTSILRKITQVSRHYYKGLVVSFGIDDR